MACGRAEHPDQTSIAQSLTRVLCVLVERRLADAKKTAKRRPWRFLGSVMLHDPARRRRVKRPQVPPLTFGSVIVVGSGPAGAAHRILERPVSTRWLEAGRACSAGSRPFSAASPGKASRLSSASRSQRVGDPRRTLEELAPGGSPSLGLRRAALR